MKKNILTLMLLFCSFSLTLAQDDDDKQKNHFFETHNLFVEEMVYLNTRGSEIGPTVVNNQLWFSSIAGKNMITKRRKKNDENNYYKLYATAISPTGEIQTVDPTILYPEYDFRFHKGPVSYCRATGELFMTVSNIDSVDITSDNVLVKEGHIRLKLITLKQKGTEWVEVGDFPYNRKHYSIAHPCISKTGDTLFFASNGLELGATGGNDIFMCIRKDGVWEQPVVLGEEINTPEQEMFPTLFRNNTLVYASNGKVAGKLDFDLYYSVLTPEGFSEARPIKDLNTDKDDFGLTIPDAGRFGYFVSNRDGGTGDDDIYQILCRPKYTYLRLEVLNGKDRMPIANATLTFNDDTTGTTNASGEYLRIIDADGSYSVSADMKGFLPYSTVLNKYNTDKQGDTISKTIYMRKMEVGVVTKLQNIHYDFDSWKILPESEVELNKLVDILKKNPTCKVELGSHTDSRGRDKYNMRLSQKRSESAVAYIVSQGIDKDRIVAKGYGETMLINRCKNGVDCSEEEHRENRRTEFKILEL